MFRDIQYLLLKEEFININYNDFNKKKPKKWLY